MRYRVKHKTAYTYDAPASLCHNLVFQGPLNSELQRVLEHHFQIIPEPTLRRQWTDFFENPVLYFALEQPHDYLEVAVTSEVELFRPVWMDMDPTATMPWEQVSSWLKTPAARNDTRQFYLESPHVSFHPEICAYARTSFQSDRPILAAARDLCKRIYKDFKFTPGFTEISTPIQTVFRHRKGVCQDYAHLMLSCLRSMGLAARYVSGYIETIPPPGKEKLQGSDASHAWVSVFVPDVGWVELDATNNLLVNDQHIRVAYGRDFSDVVPLKGIVYSSGDQKMKVSVDVTKQPA